MFPQERAFKLGMAGKTHKKKKTRKELAALNCGFLHNFSVSTEAFTMTVCYVFLHKFHKPADAS